MEGLPGDTKYSTIFGPLTLKIDALALSIPCTFGYLQYVMLADAVTFSECDESRGRGDI